MTERKRLERCVLALIVVTGIASVVTQIVTIREFLSQFHGNEIVIALTLFNWLVEGAAGTFMSYAVAARFVPTPRRLAVFSIILGLLGVVQIPATRILRNIIFIPGSSVGFYPTWLFTFIVTLPYCVLLGFVLPYSLFLLRRHLDSHYPGAKIYITDSIGDICGGLLFSSALVFVLTPVKAVSVAALPLIAVSWLLARLAPLVEQSRPNAAARVMPALLVFLTLLALILSLLAEYSTLSTANCRLAEYHESRFGRIVVCEDSGQFTLLQDGVPLFSSENRALAEESVHYLLAQLDTPREILVISAMSGMMKEIMKYPVKHIDYVELDPVLADSVFRYGLVEKGPAIHQVHMDGRAWLNRTDKLYDAIIINITEPDTFQANRFYTEEFYLLASKHLNHGGGLLFSAEGYDSYIGGPELEKISIMKKTAGRIFKNVMLLPGNRVFFICSNSPLQRDIPALLEKRGIRTWYISNFFHGNVTPDRIEQLESAIDADAPVNTDLTPRLMKIMFEQWFFKYASSPYLFTAILLTATALYLWRLRPGQYLIFSTGAMVMGCETLVIFTFQAFYGYIYFMIGILVTVFLAGLLPGAVASSRIEKSSARRLLKQCDTGLIVLMLLFLAWMAAGMGQNTPVWCFLLFGFTVSLLCGMQFPAALKLEGDTDSATAHTFSADIAGAGLGSLLVSLFLIPRGGLPAAAAVLILIKTSSLCLLWRRP